jgi:hypothetical protein
MFVIPVKYRPDHNFVLQLVPQIRVFHPHEKIVVVDSDSEDKSYFREIEKWDVVIEDVKNHNWHHGAQWHCFNKFPDEQFFFCLHDSVIVKNNMDYLKDEPLTILYHFPRTLNDSFNFWKDRIVNETSFKTYTNDGKGCFAGMFMCQRWVMEKLKEAGVDKLLPSNKPETGYLEGAYGFFFEQLGFDLAKCALYGDFCADFSDTGRCKALPPHTTEWQWPIEKFFAFHQGRVA